MKSSRFIFIFIALSLLLHIVLFFISLEPVQAVPDPEPKKLIPVDLAMKMKPDPPAVPETPPTPEPVKPEAVPIEPQPQPAVPEPEPAAEPAAEAEPAPEPLLQPESEPPASRSPAPATETRPSPQAQPAAPQQRESGTLAENPFAGLLERINENKKSTYPLSARKKGHQGTVFILLLLDAEGYMISAEVVQKSSHSSLNTAALKLIDKIMETPYPHNQGKTVRLKLPITYRLDS